MPPERIQPINTPPIRVQPVGSSGTVYTIKNAYRGNYEFFGKSPLFPNQKVTTVEPEQAIQPPPPNDNE